MSTAKELVEEMLSHIKPYGTCGEHIFVNATTGQFNNWLNQALAKLAVEEQEKERFRDDNKKIKSDANEIYRHVMWVAVEFGKVLQERADLQKELAALNPSKGGEG